MSTKPLILVVDDNELLRLGCRMAFERAGFEVLLAENGREGLELARAHLPDLVLLDLNMPVLNGWQTVRVLSQDSRTAGIPVVAFTAERFSASLGQLHDAGFTAYARKGETLQSVIDLVRQCLSDQDGDKDRVEPGGPGSEPWRMSGAG